MRNGCRSEQNPIEDLCSRRHGCCCERKTDRHLELVILLVSHKSNPCPFSESLPIRFHRVGILIRFQKGGKQSYMSQDSPLTTLFFTAIKPTEIQIDKARERAFRVYAFSPPPLTSCFAASVTSVSTKVDPRAQLSHVPLHSLASKFSPKWANWRVRRQSTSLSQ